MKGIITGVFTLLILNLNAQTMKDPQAVVTGLFIATDQQNWAQVQQAFAPTVTLDYSSMNGQPAAQLTPEQIVTAWQGILPGFQSTHHQLGNLVTTINGDQATVFCYGTASHYLPDDQGNLWIVVGTYDFKLAKSADGLWQITSMTFHFKYQDGNTALPEKAINSLK